MKRFAITLICLILWPAGLLFAGILPIYSIIDIPDGTILDFNAAASESIVNDYLVNHDVEDSIDHRIRPSELWVAGNPDAPLAKKILYSDSRPDFTIRTTASPWSTFGISFVSGVYGGSTTMTLVAFDIDNNLIGTVSNESNLIDRSQQAYNDGVAFIGFSSDVPVYSVQLQTEYFTAMDNLTFVSIPEPCTLILLSLGGLMLRPRCKA